MVFFINPVLVSAAFVCIAFSLVGASDDDDHSRFAYDHQMLDKIVKVEQKVEQIDKTLKDSLESFLAILQYRKDEMQTQGDRLTGNLTDFKKDIQARLQYRKEEMQTLGESLSDNLTEFRKEMQEMYGVSKIAFRATNPSTSTYSANQVLILRDTSLNEGSGYNGTTGEFTAPLAGLYLFSAHVCTSIQSYAHIVIVVGRKDVANSQTSYSCGSVSTVTNVEKGEKVFIKATSTTKIITDSYRQSSFTGVRLSN